MSFRPIYAKQSKSLLNKTSSLKQLVNNALWLDQLQECLNLYLPLTIRENCSVASFKKGILTIYASNAHWATRLRYQQKNLQQQLEKHTALQDINKIVIKVFPNPLKEPEENHCLTLSSTSAQVIIETAQHIQHPALKAALERLARHTN